MKKDIENNLEKIKKLLSNPNAKIVSITHGNCMDGAGSQIGIANSFKNVEYRKAGYHNINRVLEELNYDAYDCVLLTDISPEQNVDLLKHEKIILIDHHSTALKYHDPENLCFVYEEKAASLLVKEWLEIALNIDLSHLDDLMRYINDYDLWIHEHEQSEKFKMLYYHMGDIEFRTRFHGGCVIFTEKDNSFFLRRERDFNKLYDELEIFELETIKGCLVIIDDFINEIPHQIMENETDINLVIIKNPKSGGLSIRSNIKDANIGLMLEELGIGGGHAQACGMHSPNAEAIKNNIKLLEKTVFDKFPHARK